MGKNTQPSRFSQLKKQAAKKKRQETLRRRQREKKPEPKMGMQKFRKATGRIAVMVMEPEFMQIKIDVAVLKSLHESNMTLPQQIRAFFTPLVLGEIKAAVAKITERPTSNELAINARTMLQMFEQELPPVEGLGIFAGFFLQKRYALLGLGSPVNVDTILSMVKEYEREYNTELKPIVEGYIAQHNTIPAETHFAADKMGETKIQETGGFITTNDEMRKLHQSILKQESGPSALELEDDLEVFLFDYLADTGTYEPGDIEPKHFRDFLGSWFGANLNPSADDRKKMCKHLNMLVAALMAQQSITPEAAEKMKSYLDGE